MKTKLLAFLTMTRPNLPLEVIWESSGDRWTLEGVRSPREVKIRLTRGESEVGVLSYAEFLNRFAPDEEWTLIPSRARKDQEKLIDSVLCPWDESEILPVIDVVLGELDIRMRQLEELESRLARELKSAVRADLVDETGDLVLDPLTDEEMQLSMARDMIEGVARWAANQSKREQKGLDRLHLVFNVNKGTLEPDPTLKNA
jgi:hypothetical protein